MAALFLGWLAQKFPRSLNVRSWPNDGLVGLVLDGCHIVGQMGAEVVKYFNCQIVS
jgi:hypothetical protein